MANPLRDFCMKLLHERYDFRVTKMPCILLTKKSIGLHMYIRIKTIPHNVNNSFFKEQKQGKDHRKNSLIIYYISLKNIIVKHRPTIMLLIMADFERTFNISF